MTYLMTHIIIHSIILSTTIAIRYDYTYILAETTKQPQLFWHLYHNIKRPIDWDLLQLQDTCEWNDWDIFNLLLQKVKYQNWERLISKTQNPKIFNYIMHQDLGEGSDTVPYCTTMINITQTKDHQMIETWLNYCKNGQEPPQGCSQCSRTDVALSLSILLAILDLAIPGPVNTTT